MIDEVATRWSNDLARIWECRDVEAACRLFEYTEVYLETPFADNAAATPDGIRLLWTETVHQVGISVVTSVECVERHVFVTTYRASYSIYGSHKSSAGVWIVELDKNAQCKTFRQFTASGS
jgi:hypothetical protein